VHPKNLIRAAIVLVLVISGSAIADDNAKYPCATTSFFTAPEPGKTLAPAQRPQRLAFAESLEAATRLLDDAVPSLSPDDREWLNGELTSTNGKRQLEAQMTTQYFKWVVKLRTTERLQELRGIKQAKSISEEMTWWLGLAASYSDSEFVDGLVQLAERGVISKAFLPYPNITGDSGNGTWRVYWNEHALQSYCGNQSRDIIIWVVHPYLQAIKHQPQKK
jgi:hypothetical protein